MKALQFNTTIFKAISAKILEPFTGKRIYFDGPFKTVGIVDIEDPELPSEDWVKIKTIYCGFCGSDLNLIQLHDSPSATPFTSLPCIMGHEVVGEIVSAGANAKGIEKGDRVVVNPILGCETRNIFPVCKSCGDGREGGCENFAEGSLSPGMFLGINNGLVGGFSPFLTAHKSKVFKVPKGMTSETAVMTEPLAVSLQSVFDNMPEEGENILVVGGGVIGNLIVQVIKVFSPSVHVTVIEPSSFAKDLAKRAGADEIIHPKDVLKKTAEITEATFYKPMIGKEISMGGFDRVFDTVATGKTLNQSMRLLRANGTLSIVGIGNDVRLDLTPLWLKLQTVKGVFAYGKVIYNGKERHVFDIALELLDQKKIAAEMLLTHKFRLESYKEMIEVNFNKATHKAFKTVMKFE